MRKFTFQSLFNYLHDRPKLQEYVLNEVREYWPNNLDFVYSTKFISLRECHAQLYIWKITMDFELAKELQLLENN